MPRRIPLATEASAAALAYRWGMDVASMIMGASIASIAWIAFVPWTKLARLRELDAEPGRDPGTE